MRVINFKKDIKSTVESAVEKITNGLKGEGFGILTRIDLHSKIKEKIGKDIPITVVLGACHPGIAYEAFSRNTDFASLLPCNAVVRDLGQGRVSIELAKPTSMMEILGDQNLVEMARAADATLQKVFARIQ